MKTCPKCGEQSEDAFDACWKCGADFRAGAPAPVAPLSEQTLQPKEETISMEPPAIAQPAFEWSISHCMTCVVVVAGLIPATYLADEIAKWMARSFDIGGPMVAIVLVALAGGLLVGLAAATTAAAKKWPYSAAVPFVLLIATTVWMLTTLKDACEGLVVFAVTIVALGAIALFLKLYGSISKQ
jgi:hypothetical protein